MLERVLGEGQGRMSDAETGRRCLDATWVGCQRLNLMLVISSPQLHVNWQHRPEKHAFRRST